MQISMTVVVPESQPHDTFLSSIAQRTEQLFGDLGYTVEVAAEAGDALSVAGIQIPTATNYQEIVVEPADEVIISIAASRTNLSTAEALHDPDTGLLDRIGRWLLAGLGARWDGTLWDPAGFAEEELAARLAPTDVAPLRISMTQDDIERLFPTLHEILDDGLHELLFDRFNIALPCAAVIDHDVEPGFTAVRVRDLRFPKLALLAEPDAASVHALQYWTEVASTNTAALFTPPALEAVLVLANAAFPAATTFTERRWKQASLLNIVRFKLADYRWGPVDLPALIDQISLAPHPEPDQEDAVVTALVAGFPGVATSGMLTSV